jgi:PKD repeat protein
LFGCSDAAQPDPANVGFGGRDVVVESLSVILSADPTAGSINTKFNLFSQVAGSATGNANFKFDCNNGGAWEYEIDDIDLLVSDPGWVMRQGENTKVIAPDIFTVKDLCQYSISDIYTASSLVERGTSSAQDTLLINIGVSDDPEAINLQDNNSSADYCFVSTPPIILSWTFSDVNPGDTQSAYQVQVATNPGFGSPVIDTGKVQSANSEYSPPGLSFAEIYFWRVTVWDSLDNVSPFAEGVAFTTPDHAYPFSDFTWIPTFPLPEEEIQFQDTTIFAPGSFNQSWLWSFGDGTTSTQQNSVHTYNDPSPYVVSLKSSDDVGSCGGQVDLDGDGIPNEIDDDIDGDGILNEDDDDIDGDGISNGQDFSPNGSGGSGESGASIINVALPFPDYQEISPF